MKNGSVEIQNKGNKMRDIKFRAWDAKEGRFYRRLLIGNTANRDSDDYVAHCYWSDLRSDWVNFDELDNISIEQYIGLKDKNGVDYVCEGDIVKCRARNGVAITRYIGEVKFSSVYHSYVVAGVKQHFGRELNLHELSRIEVIGNIHENPELLER